MPGSSGGSSDGGHLFSSYGVPLAVAATTTTLGFLSYHAYKYLTARVERQKRAQCLLARAKSSPGELPFKRPISMGGEEKFHGMIQASNLPHEVLIVSWFIVLPVAPTFSMDVQVNVS